MSRSLVVCAVLLCAPVLAATYFAEARNVACADGKAMLARSWQSLLAQDFEAMPQGWEAKNYESNLVIETRAPAHGGAGALWLTYAKEKDTAWELIAPPVPVAGLVTVQVRLWLRNNLSLANTNPHQDSYFSCVEFRRDDGTVAGRLPLEWGALNETWHEVVITGTVPDGAAVAVLRMGWDGPNLGAGEYVAIDDLRLLGQGREPAVERDGEWTSGPLACSGPAKVGVAWQADTPAQTAVRVRLEGQGATADAWQALGEAITRSGGQVAIPAGIQRVRCVAGLSTTAPALSPTLTSVTLTAGKQTVRLDQFQGVDAMAPTLADFGPTRVAEPPAALHFRVQDQGLGVAPSSVRMWLDGNPVVPAAQADGSFSYRPPQPLAPPSLGPGFVGWRTRNHMGALVIGRVEGQDDAASALRVTRPAGPTDTAFALSSPPIGVMPGGSYTLSFRVRSDVDLSHASGFGGGVAWRDAEGKPLGEVVPIAYGSASADWHEVRQTLPAPAGAAEAVITLGWDNPNLANGQFVEFASPVFNGPRPATNPGPNLHQVRVVAADYAGNRLDRTWFLLVKAPPTQGRVTVREDGVTLIDGKPFFPIGIYSVSRRPANNNSYDDAFTELRAAGFNLAHTYASTRNAEFAEFYAAAARHGMKLWVAPETGNNNPDAAGALLTVARECNESALVAWYLADDTSGHIGPDELRGVHQAIMEADPYHITVQADGIGGVDDQRYVKYVNSTTGFLPEIYPIRQKTGNHVADVIRSMKNVQAGWKAAGRITPVWAIIQDFEGWGWQRFPTNEEERCMVYLALIHGAQGMTWYTYAYRDDKHGAPWDPQIWAYLKGIATELSSLSDFFTAPAPREPVEGRVVAGPEQGDLDYPSLNLRLMTSGGKRVLLAANSAEAPITAQLKLPGLQGEAEVLFENRKVPGQAGAVTDEFAPLAVHVYRW